MSYNTLPRAAGPPDESVGFHVTTAENRHTLPRRASAVSAGQSTDQRRSRRAEMRSFYGMKTAATNAGGGDQVHNLHSDCNLDSPEFDSNAFLLDLANKSSLRDLMRQGSELAADVGNLQGSRHSLVYNHHHQLFAAGDTIARLNSRTPELLGIMTNLQQSFSEISRLVDEVVVEQGNYLQARTWGEEVDRIKLMIRAGEPKNDIRTRLEKVRLESGPTQGMEAQSKLASCESAWKGMQEDDNAIGKDQGTEQILY